MSPKHSGYGYDISIYRISWYRMMRGMISRCIAIYHALSHTQDHLETPGKSKFNENPPPRCGLLLLFSALPLPSSWPVWPFLSSFCCPSAGHIIGLTVPPANSDLLPSGLGLLPERMYVFDSFFFFFSFLFFSFFPCLFDTWYLVLLIVVARYLTYYCCWHSRAFYDVIVILCCCRAIVWM